MAGYDYAYRGYSTYNDADGRKHLSVSYNPSNTETRVVETETVVNDYGNVKDQRHRSSIPVHGHGLRHKVDEFLTKVQTEASKPKKFGLLSPSFWHRTPNSTGHQGYGDYKESGQNGDYGNYSHNNHDRMEPAMITTGGWERPNRAGWATPPDTALSRTKNDIGTAARPTSVTASPHSRMTMPITTGPKRDQDYGQTIDSREAARRYGNLNSSSAPKKMYTGTIDSREAARKYKGSVV